jgi:hypothetical protein
LPEKKLNFVIDVTDKMEKVNLEDKMPEKEE